MNTHKAILLLSAAILTTLSGCVKPEPAPPPTPPEVKVTSVTVTPATLSLVEGESQELKVAVLPSDATNPTVTWSSSDAQVASVTNGTVKALKAGTATITATADGKQGSCKVTVTAKPVPVSGVTLDVTSATLMEDETLTLTATVEPAEASDKSVSWDSSDTEIASVDQDGIVTAIKAGNAVITVKTTDGGKTATCEITVKAKELSYVKMEAAKLADMNTGRSSFAIFRTGDEIVVAGGHTNSFRVSNTAEYYDLATDKWTALPDMTSHHDNTTAAPLGDGKYMILGGCRSGGGSGVHNRVDIYDPATHSFSTGPNMAAGRALFRALGFGNGKVLVSGNWYSGDSIEEYTTESGAFSFVKDISQARSYPYMLRTSDDNAIVFGYYSNYGGTGDISVDRYKGDAYTVPLFEEWHPMGSDAGWSSDLIYIGKAASGEYRYLVPLFKGNSPNEASAFGLALVNGEEFSLVETDFEIPVYNENDQRIAFVALVTDPSKEVAYMFGSNILSTGMQNVSCYILKIDYSGIAAGGKAKITMYYSDPLESFNCGGQGGIILLPDGRVMVCGGIYNSNYTTFTNAYAFKPF